MTITNITDQERLRVWRRRKGWSQERAARHFKVTPQKYFRWEHGQDGALPSINLSKLKAHEVCFLMRKRVGLRQEALAKALKVCRWWLNQMERGLVPNNELINYWSQRNGHAPKR